MMAVAALLVTLVAPASADAAPAPTCGGQRATIIGTARAETLVGTPGADVIHGGPGNDTIIALAGDDIVCGGSGHDTIRTAAGDDRILAGDGNDRVEGGRGDDVIRGGDGRDELRGEAGDDRLIGNGGPDDLGGGSGHDLLYGNDGGDTARGHAGRDSLRGGPGPDDLDGGAGDDIVVSGSGDDRLNGGGDRDLLRGGDHDDRLDGGPAADVIRGGRGDDRVMGGTGADDIDAGRGDDRCRDATGDDTTICEGSPPPAGTFGCLPPGRSGTYKVGFNGWAADPTSRPRGPVVVIGDSLTFSDAARNIDVLARTDFGPICVDGVLSRAVSRAPAGYHSGLEGIDRVRRAHPIWSSDATWVVSLGTNDSRWRPVLTPQAARTEASRAVEAIGPAASDWWWINVRTVEGRWQANETTWNEAVAGIPEMGVVDWSAVTIGRPDLFFDGIHPTETGKQLRLDLLADALGAG